jgi:hypothetical protein
MKFNSDFGVGQKKITKEERMEEEFCHGEAMGQMEDCVGKDILDGDKSLRAVLIKEREKEELRREAERRKEAKCNFRYNRRKLEVFFKTNIEEMMDNNKKLVDTRENYRLQKVNYLSDKELCYEMDPFTWELVKCKDGSTKVKIVGEDDKFKKWDDEKVLTEGDIICIRNPEINFNQFEDEEEELESKQPVTFGERREIIDKSYKVNFEILKQSHKCVRGIELNNERLRRLVIEKNNPEGLKYLKSWKFFKCTNGKTRIIKDERPTGKIDPQLEKKTIENWRRRNNAIFEKRRMTREKRKKLQLKVDKLEIIKGFLKAVCQYCSFSPEDYDRKKEELKIERAIAKFLSLKFGWKNIRRNLMGYMELIVYTERDHPSNQII